MERYVEASTFGPPSKPFRIIDFLKEAGAFQSRNSSVLAALKNDSDAVRVDSDEGDFEPIPENLRTTIASECSIDDLEEDAATMLRDSKLSNFLQVYHDKWRINQAKPSPPQKGKGKQKVVPTAALEDRLDDPRTAEAYQTLEAVKLRSWTTPSSASFYIRSVQAGDRNVLSSVKANPLAHEEGSSSILDNLDPPSIALITYAHYARGVLYPHHFRLTSQHIILSQQTLGDIWDNLPCDHKVLPIESPTDSAVRKYRIHESPLNGAAICVEDVVYGDGLSKPDYAEKLRDYVNRKGPGMVKRGGLMHDAKLADLEMRLHQPYWLLHQGECDHLIVLTQVRLLHPSDPKIGYPLLIQRAPSPHPICRICTRFAAELSIVGDVRIGEHTALVCGACWKSLGEPVKGRDDPVIVVPLLREGILQ